MAPPHLGLVACVRWNPTVTCNSRWGRAWLAIFDRQKCNFFFLLLGRLRHLLIHFFQPERRRLSTFLSTTDYRIIMNQGDRKSFLPLGHFNSNSSTRTHTDSHSHSVSPLGHSTLGAARCSAFAAYAYRPGHMFTCTTVCTMADAFILLSCFQLSCLIV